MQRYNLDILGISECRWSGSGRLKTQTGETILYSGRDDNIHQSAVALVMTKQAAGCLENWMPVSDRIMSAQFTSRHKCLRRILKIYWPMKVTNEEIRFKTNMEEITHQIKRRRWKLIGHVLRKNMNENTRIALTWTPEGRCKRGSKGDVAKNSREETRRTWVQGLERSR